MSTDAVHGFIPEVTIADRLRIARESAGLEQIELAERTQISRSTIQNYENRNWDRERKVVFIKTIALALGVDATWLLTGAAPHPAPDGVRDNVTRDVKACLRIAA